MLFPNHGRLSRAWHRMAAGFTALLATPEKVARPSIEESTPWRGLRAGLRWILGTIGVAAALAGIYAVVQNEGDRRQESAELLRGVEELLIYQYPIEGALSSTDHREIGNSISKAYTRHPRSPRAWALSGIQHALINPDRTLALSFCRRALRFDRNDPIANVCAGIALYGLKDYVRANEHLSTALAADPSLALAWFFQGQSLWMLDKIPDAEKALFKAWSLDAPRADYGLALARFFMARGRRVEALSTLREIVASDGSAEARNALAVVLHAVGNTDDAISVLESVIADDKTKAQYVTNMACLLNTKERFADALPVALKALGLQPGSRDATVELVFALVGLEKHEAAIVYSRRLNDAASGYRWVRANQEYLASKARSADATGTFVYIPATVDVCSGGWSLTRFSEVFREMVVALIVEDDYVFPSDMAGRRAGNEGFEVPPGEHSVRISCASPGPEVEVSPELLGPEWMRGQ